jgi:sulfite reductase alpha subunit-like flavoprotein
VISNDRITAEGHWQDLRLIQLDVPRQKMEYAPGDVLMVMPQNSEENVTEFCRLLNINPSTVVSLAPRDPGDFCLFLQLFE